MKRVFSSTLLLSLLATYLLGVCQARASILLSEQDLEAGLEYESPHLGWGYRGLFGPKMWGTLSGSFACDQGHQQSPIAIETHASQIQNTIEDQKLALIPIGWNSSSMTLLNNGHTLEAIYDYGSSLVWRSEIYSLKQFHFHSPAEHLLDGKRYPLEVHFVHTSHSRHSKLLVVSVFMDFGAPHVELQEILNHAPLKPSHRPHPKAGSFVHAREWLPSDRNYVAYEGSLTTPPCTEGVQWIVMTSPREVSRSQVSLFQRLFSKSSNFRPLQPLFDRIIRKSHLF